MTARLGTCGCYSLCTDELELGNTLAFELLPRLCALAVQTGDPRAAMAKFVDRIQDPTKAAAAALLPALEFCHWRVSTTQRCSPSRCANGT